MLPGVSGVAWLPMPPGKENCLKKRCSPAAVFALFRVDLGIRALEIRLGQYRGRPVPGAADVDRVEVVFFDQPVEMDVGKGLAGIRAPMAQQPRLYVLQGQRLSQQRVGLEVQHPQAQIEAGPPIRVDLAQLVGTEGCPLDRRTRPAVCGDRVVRAEAARRVLIAVLMIALCSWLALAQSGAGS